MERLLLILARDRVKVDNSPDWRFGVPSSAEVVFDRRVRDRRSNSAANTTTGERRQRERRTHDVMPELLSRGWAYGRVDAVPGSSASDLDTPPHPPNVGAFHPASVARSIRRGVLQHHLTPVLCALLLAFLLRGYWTLHHSAVLEENGSEYARIAQNLVQHRTYVGLSEGPELVMPPFFPIILALGSLVTESVDGATRLMPLLAGVLLVLAAFALARLMYGSRVAFCAAVLTAIHPLLIDLSTTALSESVYLPLMLAAVWSGLRALDSGRPSHMMWCGTFIGLMYLTRPEGVFCAAVVLAGAFVTNLGRPTWMKRTAIQALSLLAPIVVLSAPYVAYLSLHTGSLRLDGKVVLNFTIGERRNAGMSHHEAALGLGRDLSEEGPLLSASAFVAKSRRSLSIQEITGYWFQSARRNRAIVFELLAAPLYGSILAMGLVVLGLFRQPWDRHRAVREGVLLAIALGHLLLLFGLHAVLGRYLLPLLPLCLIWVSKGIDEAAWWAVQTSRRIAFTASPFPAHSADFVVRCVLIGGVLGLAFWGARWGTLADQSQEASILREVGIWLDHSQPGPKTVMTRYPQVAYYSGGTWLHMPYADGSLALQYAHRKGPDFIVLIGEEPFAPYLREWLRKGIPDSSARLVYSSTGASPTPVAIYEWRRE